MTTEKKQQRKTWGERALQVEQDAAAMESIVLSVLGRVASWVGPLPIAVFTASETQSVFGVDPWMALSAAVAMELVGVKLANSWLTAAEHNAGRKLKSEPRANEGLAFGLMAGFYVMDLAISTIIVWTRIAAGLPWTNLIAIAYPVAAALSIISMNQGVSLQRAKARWAQERASKASEKASTKQVPQEQPQPLAPDYASMATRDAILSYYQATPKATQASAAQEIGVSRQRIGQMLATLEQDGAIKRNGKGVEVLVT